MLRQAQRISLARRLSRPLSSESSAPSTPRAFAVPRPRFNPAATATRGDRPPFQRREGEQTPREQTPREPRFGTLVEGNEMEGLVLRNDPAFRQFVVRDSQKISPWHNIELFAKPEQGEEGLFVNYVCEIPRGTVEKMEVATKEPYNPLKQDVKNGALRNYPFQSLCNYGMLPQTWEDPDHKDESTGLGGDNDPLDVCEISGSQTRPGDVRTIKVLGILGMLDQGEMDWKIIGLNANARQARFVHTIADVDRVFPNRVAQLVHWFKVYKKPDGKPENQFAFDGAMQSTEFALSVIEQTHQAYMNKDKLKRAGFWVG